MNEYRSHWKIDNTEFFENVKQFFSHKFIKYVELMYFCIQYWISNWLILVSIILH